MAWNPFTQIVVLRLEFEIQMLGILNDRSRAARRADGIAQFFRTVGRATLVAAVAVLTLGSALRTRTLNEAVRQKHLAMFAVKLGRRLLGDEALLFRGKIDLLRKRLVLGRIGRIVIVEGDLEIGKILEMGRVRAGD